MAERKLATVRKISTISDIPGKDRIALAMVDGWSVIVQKAEFKPDDLCVFFEIDSVLPDAEWCSFLKEKRIRTMKMAGCLSQGIVFPLSIMSYYGELICGNGDPEDSSIIGFYHGKKAVYFEVGLDLTDVIGVTKWERPDAEDVGDIKTVRSYKKFPNFLMRFKWFRDHFVYKNHGLASARAFPEFLTKTDEIRCLSGNTYVETDHGKKLLCTIVNKQLDVKVRSYDFEKDEVVYKPIVSYQRYANDDGLYEIAFTKTEHSNRLNRIRCTPDHKILTTGKVFKRADEINQGDSIYYSAISYGEEVIQAIYGMLLGDSCLSFDRRVNKDGSLSKNPRICFSQGEAQLDYLQAKLSRFAGKVKIREGKSGYTDRKVYQAHLPVDQTITNAIYEDTLIDDGRFTITERFCSKLTPLSLALWYMDDGCIRHNNEEDPQRPSVQLSSNAFSYEENQLLSDCLKRFGIDSNIWTERKGDKVYYSLALGADATQDFLKLVAPFMPECMRYKLTPEFRSIPCVFNELFFERRERLFENKIVSVEYKPKSSSPFARQSYVYDLEIADTHNFFADDVLHHNCQNCPWVLDRDDTWVLTEKVDGSSGSFAVRKEKHGIFKREKLEFYVCSRNRRLFSDDGSSYWRVANAYNLKAVLTSILKEQDLEWVAVQGEVVGPKIQGNKYGLKEPDLYVFNFITDKDGRWSSADGKRFLESKGMKWVPIVGIGGLPKAVDDMLTLAHGKSKLADTLREGLVCRSMDGKQSFKAVDPEFLMKWCE